MDLTAVRRSLLDQSSKILYDAHDLVFDGTNYIDTGIYLYSAENIDKDFEITLNIGEDLVITGAQEPVISSMLELRPYPGFVIRRRLRYGDLQVSGGRTALVSSDAWPVSEILNKDIHFRREGLSYSAWVDGYGKVYSGSTQFYTSVFDVPVTLGAGLDGDLNPFRYWKGTINHIRIEYI